MLIKTEHELNKLVAKALCMPAVAIDTEFVWERTFYPNLGLVQLALERECYLIDPVCIKDLSELGRLLSEPSVCKILHDAQQDLTILKAATGVSPKNIFDTRLAYGFVGASSVLSLASLLEETLNIKLPKTETRANWVKRPLTDNMIEYACDDVKYLTELMHLIINKAEENNTISWLETEMKKFDSASLYAQIQPREYFRKLKGADNLKGRKLAVLRELAGWREKTARRKNRPRGHVIHNYSLIAMAYKCPKKINELKNIDRLSPNSIRKYGSSLINCIQKGLDTPKSLYPEQMEKLPRHRALNSTYKAIQTKAAELNIDPALVCSRKELNVFLNGFKDDSWKKSKLAKDWRKEFAKEILAEQIQS
jgi:ribonuclease D